MTKSINEIIRKIDFGKVIENKEELLLYKKVTEDIITYITNNYKATFQEIIHYVNGSDRRTLRLLDQLVKLNILKYEKPYFYLFKNKYHYTVSPREVRCPLCDSKMINVSGNLLNILQKMKKIFFNKPVPTFVFDQRPVNLITTVRRVGYLILRGDLQNKSIIIIGDDDLTSIAIGMTKMAKEIYVLDIDKRLLNYIQKISSEQNLNITTIYCDLTAGIPNNLKRSFDVFMTDPTPTEFPFTIFVNAGVELIKKEEGAVGYISIFPSCKIKSIKLQKIMTDMNLMITDLIPYFTEYDYIKYTFTQEDLKLLKKYEAPEESKISFFEYLLRVETTKRTKPKKIHYNLNDVIGSATKRVLNDFAKDPVLGGSNGKDLEYVRKIAKKLQEKIKTK